MIEQIASEFGLYSFTYYFTISCHYVVKLYCLFFCHSIVSILFIPFSLIEIEIFRRVWARIRVQFVHIYSQIITYIIYLQMTLCLYHFVILLTKYWFSPFKRVMHFTFTTKNSTCNDFPNPFHFLFFDFLQFWVVSFPPVFF